MIDVVTSIKFVPGKGSQAREWAKKILAYQKKAGLLSGPIFLLQAETGERSKITFVEQQPSMAKYEETKTKMRADSGRMAIVKEMLDSDWFLGGTRHIYDVLEVVE